LLAVLLLGAILFLSIALHELGHSFVAIRKGCRVREITLTFIGGAAQMEDIPRRPMDEFLMAIAGPAVSVVLGCAGLFGARSLSLHGHPVFRDLSEVVATINFMLAGFNLVPAFPMDGGRVLRALLSPRMGRLKATRVASRLGRAIAVLFVVAGALAVVVKPVARLLGFSVPPIPNLFLIVVIGFFIYSAAGKEYQLVQIQENLEREGFKAWPPPPNPPPLPDEPEPRSGDDQVSISPPPYRKGPDSKAPIRPEDQNPFHNLFDR
jgi:Zn-dependent protease